MTDFFRAVGAAYRFRSVWLKGSSYFEDASNAPKFKKLLIENGPMFVKIGQWMAQRPDMFPLEFVDQLRELQREAPCHSFDKTKAIVEQNFGKRMDQVFETFDREPIASGSIAQVYRARFQGNDVIVKVRHPTIKKEIQRDLGMFRTIIAMGRQMKISYCCIFSVDRLIDEMLEQCDLSKEAENLREMGENFRSNPVVEVPELFFHSEDMLIESFFDGVTYRDSHKLNLDARDLAECRHSMKCLTLASFLQMALSDRIAHADMHNGNLLYKITKKEVKVVEEDVKRANRLYGDKYRDHVTLYDVKLQLIDFGIVCRLNAHQKEAVHDLFVGLYGYEAETVTDAISRVVRHGDSLSAENFKKFCSETKICLDKAEEEKNRTNVVDIPFVIRQLLSLVYKYQIVMDADVFRIVIDYLLIVEGRPHVLHESLTDDTIEWVLYGDHGEHFSVVENLLQAESAAYKIDRWRAGKGERPNGENLTSAPVTMSERQRSQIKNVSNLKSVRSSSNSSRRRRLQ